MYLSRIHLNLQCRQVRRDLSDPYQLHSTLCRAFSPGDRKCSPGEFLWRIEPESDVVHSARILVQSRSIPDWLRIETPNWLLNVDPPLDLKACLRLDALEGGRYFRYRLRANPCVTRKGKRLGLFRLEDQEAWLIRKGELHGFALPRPTNFGSPHAHSNQIDVRISQEQMIRGRQHNGNSIRVFSVLYDGTLKVEKPESFKKALQDGIGHGKFMGLGLLSVALLFS